MIALSLALSLTLSLAGAGAFAAPAESVVAANVAAKKKPLAERIVDVTAPFLGAPYRLSPLGEGPGHAPDEDPLIRYDAFDCTTFVETAMALSLADNLDEAKRLLDVIRYQDGKIDYLARRHFPEAEWIPELTRLGFLKDITREVGGADVKVESKKIDLAVWKKSSNEHTPKLPDDRIPSGTFSLDVWPLAQAKAGADKIPAGTIIHIVRVDFSNEPVRVTHQGIVIVKDGKRYLRHAADRLYHSVVDEPLDHFFHRMEQYTLWPITGVHLTLLQEPLSWRAMLTPPVVTPPPAP
ncbi:MAG TPA: N-acetylmuramoyl-L-alanine amidase-like domain-containing protein [Myxococcota bacterium]